MTCISIIVKYTILIQKDFIKDNLLLLYLRTGRHLMSKSKKLFLSIIILITINLININAQSLDEFTKVSLNFESTDSSIEIVDDVGNTWSKNGDLSITNNESIIDNSSLLCNDGYLSSNNSTDFDFKTNDFTVDTWIKCSQTPNNSGIVGQYPGDFTKSWMIKIINGNAFVTFYTNTWIDIDSGVNVTDNLWHNIVLERDNGTIKLFIDGILTNTQSLPDELGFSDQAIVIGKSPRDNVNYQGYIDGTRISNGIARYTDNFIPKQTWESQVEMKLLLEVNEEQQLSVSNYLEDNIDMSWKSSNDSIATVDNNGIVRAISPGNVIISCISGDGTFSKTLPLEVVDLELELSIDLKVGDSCRLIIDNVTLNSPFTWKTLDSNIATVTSSGRVTALNKGLTYIYIVDETNKELDKVYIRVRETI